MPAKVNWYSQRVKVQIDKQVTKPVLDALAFQIEAQTKVNITDNGQVDTGFMRNSTYVVTPLRNTHGQTAESGTYPSPKTGQSVQRNAVAAASPPEGGAIVAVAAEYAVYQETKNSFLWRAVETVAGQRADAVIRQVARL